MTLTEAQALTPEQKRVKLAELCGLEVVKLPFIPNQVNRDAYFTTEAAQALYRQYPRGKTVKGLPDYCNDLNAVAEVEKGLSEEHHKHFRVTLWKVTTGGNNEGYEYVSDAMRRAYLSATADQRTTAIILTLSQA